ncbi:MAG: GAF domain-containing sensor histidine kinase [Anaerolineaceae bacterium]|jgi:two-component system sensor histidine kinase KdpD|nr:GAF domain-containing sensor histidine kinase [Anaerolineaceae bacterium]
MDDLTDHKVSPQQDYDCLIKVSELMNQVMDPVAALSQTTEILHSIMIFDNLVVYSFDIETSSHETIYARALGRGKHAEADINWGGKLANQLFIERKMILEKPKIVASDRLKRPFMLGIPIFSAQEFLGSMILIRYGGPDYTKRDLELAKFFAQQTSVIFERENFQKEKEILQIRQQLLQLQEDFFSTISHELNSPLGFIKGYTTTLLRSDANWDRHIQLEFLKIIDQETDNMQDLISNLLDSARAQSNQLDMEFQTVRLDSLIHDLHTRASLKYPGLEIISLLPDNLAAIDADPKRLIQVLENLISNAVKYAPGSPVNITILQDEQITTLLVKDHGPGISSLYINHLFKRFVRIPDNSSGVHGSGLGLYICKKIITAHNGAISVKSTAGEGATFKIDIPNQQ